MTPATPVGLDAASRRWWRSVTEDFELEAHHLRLLEIACRAWDRAEQARRRIAADGAYLHDRFGQLRAHPAIDVERRARDQFRSMVRELGLDVSPPAETRGPAAPANSHLRVS